MGQSVRTYIYMYMYLSDYQGWWKITYMYVYPYTVSSEYFVVLVAHTSVYMSLIVLIIQLITDISNIPVCEYLHVSHTLVP
jgi:hypothetical protein